MTAWARFLQVALLVSAVLTAGRPLHAQDEAEVEALAPLLQVEDARDFAPPVLRAGLENADSLVRRTAALAVGRIGDLRGTALLLPLLTDRDSLVQADAMFALSLLRDTSAAGPILARFHSQPALASPPAVEGIATLARLGTPEAASFLAGLLRGSEQITAAGLPAIRQEAALQAWRLGPAAPVPELLALAHDTTYSMRYGTIYSLARLRARGAGQVLLDALGDEYPVIRGFAARALIRSYADSAGIGAQNALVGLRRILADEDAGVRVNALRSLATWHDTSLVEAVSPLLDDPDVNVRVEAATTLGQLGGAAASRLLQAQMSRSPWALRREALLALARVDSAAFVAAAEPWGRSNDWWDRATAARGWALVAPGPGPGHPDFLRDDDGRVAAAALEAWSAVAGEGDGGLLTAARRLLDSPDAAVRALAAGVVGQAADPADVPALVASWSRTRVDSFPDAALAALGALRQIAQADPAAEARVSAEFLSVVSRPESPLLRRWAERNWPVLADRWGPAYPLRTGRTLEDYRGVARTYLVTTGDARYPHIFIDVEGRGTLELELFGPEAPLTVANFLTLVDRHFFDQDRWHRVVPNFVIQDGDPRGDGWGGSGTEIRDEINRRRYGPRTVGMALSGPDTGDSQWFITLGPQPHLDGIYTVFGRVVGNFAALGRITQGDIIRTIRR